MRTFRAIGAAAVLLTAGCAAIHNPPAIAPESCLADPALMGVWTDTRMTPLGPAWVKFAFGADGTVESRIQLLYARITETARYRTGGGIVTFDRRSGTTRWPYRIVGSRLLLQEAANERYEYRRR